VLAVLLVLVPALWGGNLIGTVLPWRTTTVEGTVAAPPVPAIRLSRSGIPVLWIWTEEQAVPYRLQPGFFASLGSVGWWTEPRPGQRLRVLVNTESQQMPAVDPRGNHYIEVLEARADGVLLIDIFPVVARRVVWGLMLIGLAAFFWGATAKPSKGRRIFRRKAFDARLWHR
jgi:hypothetical protein